jgi:hypothetical protein
MAAIVKRDPKRSMMVGYVIKHILKYLRPCMVSIGSASSSCLCAGCFVTFGAEFNTIYCAAWKLTLILLQPSRHGAVVTRRTCTKCNAKIPRYALNNSYLRGSRI